MQHPAQHPGLSTQHSIGLYNYDLFFLVVLLQHNLDDFGVTGLHFLADIISLDGQLAMASIDQHRKLDSSRPSKIDQLIHRRANGPACVQHIVDQHDRAVGDVCRNISFVDYRPWPDSRKIVSIESDVELSGWRTFSFELLDLVRYLFGKRYTSAANTHQQQIRHALVSLDNLRRESRQCATDSGRVHYASLEIEV